MMRLPPFLEAKILAIRRRLALARTGTFDPYPPAPAGVFIFKDRQIESTRLF